MAEHPLREGDRIESIGVIRVTHGTTDIGIAAGTKGRLVTILSEDGLADVVWDNGEIDVVALDEIHAVNAIEQLGDLA